MKSDLKALLRSKSYLMANSFRKGFFKTLEILRDYLPDIVIAGGWAPFIYYHYLISNKEIEPLRTKDIDIVVPNKLEKRAAKTIDESLTEAGFKPRFRSRHILPVVTYEGNVEGYEVEIEFLTELKGSGKNVVMKVQQGLHAQALRFISLLLENTIVVKIADFMVPEGKILKIRVPAPAAFIFNKGLIFVRRNKRAKRAKDLYYIFDILANCQELHSEIIDSFGEFKKNYHTSWLNRFLRNLNAYFSDVTSEGIHLVQSQRPDGAFPHMNDEQLRQYVLGIFQEFIGQIECL